jgi:hypothetical protein
MCKFIIAQKGENVKTTKTIEEYYCDFCGAECTHNHYDITLPFITSNGYSSRFCAGEPDDNSIIIQRLDLCSKCMRINARINTFLSSACKNEVGIKQTAKQDKFAIPYIDAIGSFASRNRYPKTEHTMTIEYDE